MRQFQNRGSAIAFRISRMLNGKQVRQNFKDLASATLQKQALDAEALNLDTGPQQALTRLSSAQLLEAEQAFAALGSNRSLIDAINFYIRNYREPATQIKLKDARDLFIESKMRQNRRSDTIRNLKRRPTRLFEFLPPPRTAP
jgi:hypothetical protein